MSDIETTPPPETAPDAAPAVEAYLAALPPAQAAALRRLRALILEGAALDPRIGPLDESLKWGQPAWRARRPVGTTMRIDIPKARPDQVSLYFHCRTSLVETFRARHSDRFDFHGNRELSCPADAIPEAAVRDCARAALGWRLRD